MIIGCVIGMLAAAAVSWALLNALAPVLPVPVAAFLYGFGAVICHQISERSFHVDGAQLSVCARCLGIYAGFALGAVAMLSTAPRTAQKRDRCAGTRVPQVSF